jgi:hypothetical protein
LCKPALTIAFVYDDELLLFKQTYLRWRYTLWRGRYDDFIIFCIQVTEYLLDHQYMFIGHILVSTPADNMRCANRLSYRFVAAISL